MEPRFNADFSDVRIHTDDAAAKQSKKLDATAFTSGRDIHFGRGKFQPDTAAGKELIAHELTHTIQQGAVKQTSKAPAAASVRERPAKSVHRAGGIRGWIADKANNIPGFRMLTIVLGVNPIDMSAVDRSPANIIRAAIEFMPGGKHIGDALESHGILDRIGAWIEQKLRTLGMIGSAIKHGLDRFIDDLGLEALNPLNWGDLWADAKRIFTEPIDRLKAFIAGLASEIIQFIREAILLPLAALAEGTKGYDLLKAVLGEDPVTGQPVPRNAETLIGGFMKLIDEEEVWENIKKANAVQRCWAWFQSALNGLMGFVRRIPGEFVAAFKSLEVIDMILVPRAFAKIALVFGGFLGEFLAWAGKTMWTLLEIIFEVVAPKAIPYLKKAAGSFKDILKNPIPFVANLVKAGKLGFQKFADNVGTHLKRSLIEWLTGSLPGVYIPTKLDLKEIVKFVLSVLGLTWANIRVKLVKAIGETAVKVLETGFQLVVTLVTEGPAAAWEQIKEQLTALKDQAIAAITNFVVETIVKKAVMKVVSLLIPGGAFLQAIISIYDTILVFIDKLQKIIQVATAFLDSMMDIAGGKLENAAKKVESVLAGLLTLAISFLAGFLGLGKIADKVMEVIKKIRAPIDKALDHLVDWIVKAGKSLFGSAKAAVKDWWKKTKPFQTKGGASHEISFQGTEKNAVALVASKDKKPVAEHAKDFKKKASGPEATEAQKKTAPLIDATVALAKKDPNDPNLLVNMQLLFETYQEGGAKKESKVVRKLGSMGGDTVCLGMTIDWLDKNHPPGSTPESGAQVKLMELLSTHPGQPNPNKYIRGHLLNHNLGGLGNAENMFPITGNANSQHSSSTEKVIKGWMSSPNRWVWYDVQVTGVSSKLDGGPKNPDNFVNCTFQCRAVLKDDQGKKDKDFSTTITSTYKKAEKATVVDNIKK